MYLLNYILLFLISNTFVVAVRAQSTLSYSDGRSVMETDYSNTIGSPYLVNDWSDGSVSLNNGKVYQNISLKYNEKDDELYFKNDKNEPMVFNDLVKSFTIQVDNRVHFYRNGYPDGLGITNKSYLDVLVNGKVEFLKHNSKTVIDSKDYTSAVVNRRFMEITKYYLFISSKIYLLKKDQKYLLSLLHDKEVEVSKLIKDNNLSMKSEADIVKIVNYYNSITL